MDVNIISCPSTRIAVLQHRGSPDLVNATAARFIARRKTSGLSPVATSDTRGSHGTIRRPPAGGISFDICGTVDRPVGENAFGVINGEIPGGRCAVVRHHGSLDTLANSVWFLYRDWLPASGETLRIFRCTSVTSILSMRWLSMNCKPIFICRWPD